jgi:Telomeric repeat-binding factor 2.
MKKKIHLIPVILILTILFSSCGKIDSDGNSSKANIVTSGTEIQEEPKEPVEATISAKAGYGDAKRQINVIGFKTYKKLESEMYTDKAAKDKSYLVLFLEIYNKQNEKDYINVNYLSTKVDDTEITNTVLFNEPEGFQTVFQNIEPENTLSGFIVWEVPKDWKKIEIVYNGWKDSDNLSINCTFTPDDYFNPPKYV